MVNTEDKGGAATTGGNGEVVDYVYQNSLTWLPTSRSDNMTALASLQTCSINLTQGCDAVAEQISADYLRAWANPAPAHCQRARLWGVEGGNAVPSTTVYSDRLWLPRAGANNA